jgi:hypothetical protein
MALIAWFIAMAIILAIVYQMWLFDCLVRWEYEHRREQWERDGKPSGFYWRPKESLFWLSNSAMHRLAGVLVFRTPDWAVEVPECRRWILQMRLSILVAGICALLFIGVVFR